MAILSSDSSFQSWAMDKKETQQGSILSITQKQCIQNQIVQFAERKLNLIYDPLNPLNFVQQDAEIQGAIGALRSLLAISEEFELEVGQRTLNIV